MTKVEVIISSKEQAYTQSEYNMPPLPPAHTFRTGRQGQDQGINRSSRPKSSPWKPDSDSYSDSPIYARRAEQEYNMPHLPRAQTYRPTDRDRREEENVSLGSTLERDLDSRVSMHQSFVMESGRIIPGRSRENDSGSDSSGYVRKSQNHQYQRGT